MSIRYQEFTGNQEAYETKKNTLFPPVIGRFIRLHPTQWYNKATVRMEFYGCELDGKMSLTVDLGKCALLVDAKAAGKIFNPSFCINLSY